ncbi:MAG: cadherin-like domain-containing protein [Sulfurovaceae bacterium]|nr:cadherin-like domain-containing protein [Sulfurovaceae bacterium]
MSFKDWLDNTDNILDYGSLLAGLGGKKGWYELFEEIGKNVDGARAVQPNMTPCERLLVGSEMAGGILGIALGSRVGFVGGILGGFFGEKGAEYTMGNFCEFMVTPIAKSDTIATEEDTQMTINELSNDIYAIRDKLMVTATATNGTIIVNDDKTILYTPNKDFNGDDTVSYTIKDSFGKESTAHIFITVAAINDNPVANPDTATTKENTEVVINVLANDTDVDGDKLTVSIATATNGAIIINDDGTLTYTPNIDFYGNDTINYTVSDGNGGTNSSIASIYINENINFGYRITKEVLQGFNGTGGQTVFEVVHEYDDIGKLIGIHGITGIDGIVDLMLEPNGIIDDNIYLDLNNIDQVVQEWDEKNYYNHGVVSCRYELEYAPLADNNVYYLLSNTTLGSENCWIMTGL